MTDPAMTEPANLARLSAAATQGEMVTDIYPISYPECDDRDLPAVCTIDGKEIAYFGERYGKDLEHVSEADAKFTAELWNAFRSGRLVLLPSVEDLAEIVSIADNQRIPFGFANGHPDHLSDWDVWLATAIHNHLKGTGDA